MRQRRAGIEEQARVVSVLINRGSALCLQRGARIIMDFAMGIDCQKSEYHEPCETASHFPFNCLGTLRAVRESGPQCMTDVPVNPDGRTRLPRCWRNIAVGRYRLTPDCSRVERPPLDERCADAGRNFDRTIRCHAVLDDLQRRRRCCRVMSVYDVRLVSFNIEEAAADQARSPARRGSAAGTAHGDLETGIRARHAQGSISDGA